MLILYPCHLNPSTTDLPLLLSQAWRRHGVEVDLISRELDFEQPGQFSWSRMLQLADARSIDVAFGQQIVERACRTRPEILLLGYPFLTPDQRQCLRRRAPRTRLGLFLGYNHLLTPDTTDTIRDCDFIIVHDSYLLPILQGERYGHRQQVWLVRSAADPVEHCPLALSESDRHRFACDVAFIGGYSACREEWLSHLQGVSLRIWGGREWARSRLANCYCSEPVYGRKKTKIYNAARIVLNLEDREKQVSAISERVPEVLACGGFVLTEARPDLALTGLVPGESVATFETPAELSQAVTLYLGDPQRRAAISAAGRQQVLQQATYDHVANELLAKFQHLLNGV